MCLSDLVAILFLALGAHYSLFAIRYSLNKNLLHR